MQRVRIGLTGLACVFLLVLLGAAFVKAVHDSEVARQSDIAVAASSGSTPPKPVSDEPKEPLAELGITPGNAPETGTSSKGAKSR
jgi:hypothetical protein